MRRERGGKRQEEKVGITYMPLVHVHVHVHRYRYLCVLHTICM